MGKWIDWIRTRRYGPIGSSTGVGIAILFGLWTVLESIGFQGSYTLFLILLNISTFISFILFHFLTLERFKYIHSLNLCRTPFLIDRNKRKGLIGIVAPISSWPTMFYVDTIKSIRDAADREREDLQRQLLVIDIPKEEFTSLSQEIICQVINDIDGLISININFPPAMCDILNRANIPVVNIHHEQKGYSFITSLIPEHNAFQDLINHMFIEKECKTAFLITKGLANPFKNIKVDPFRKDKRDIFTTAAKASNFTIHGPTYLMEFEQDIEHGSAYILEIDRYISEYGVELFKRIQNCQTRSVAFIFLADVLAIGFLNECNKSGISAETRGWRVSGFDNTEESKWFNLTTIDYELKVVGNLAYNRLQSVLENPSAINYVTEYVKTSFLKRKSSDW